MSLISTNIGALSNVFVGTAGQGSALTQLTSNRTSGGKLTFNVPETFVDQANNTVQSSRVVLTVNLTWLTDELTGSIDQLISLAMGNPISTSPSDSPSTFGQLAVFLQHPNGTNMDSSIYIPLCLVKKTLDENWNKDKATIIPLTFTMTGRNRFSFDGTHQPYYQRTNSGLASVMGGQYPLAN